MLFSLPRKLSSVIDDSTLLPRCKYDLFRESLAWVISPLTFPNHSTPLKTDHFPPSYVLLASHTFSFMALLNL